MKSIQAVSRGLAAVILSSKEDAGDDCGPADPHSRCLCLEDAQVLIPLSCSGFFSFFSILPFHVFILLSSSCQE